MDGTDRLRDGYTGGEKFEDTGTVPPSDLYEYIDRYWGRSKRDPDTEEDRHAR